MKVNTIHGEMDDADLVHCSGSTESDKEKTEWDEYYFDERLVHRSAKITLKGAQIFGVQGKVG